VPGLSVTLKLLVPPSNVAVFPRTLFAELMMTTLWEMAELLVKLTPDAVRRLYKVRVTPATRSPDRGPGR
jgi:hypothetical protein